MKLRVGTSGYSYKEWKGHFYPEKIAAADMLRYYAGRLPAVEINNTFYRMPRTSVLESWRDQVPQSFRFVLKASRRITHFKRLRGADDETGYVVKSAATLGERLGVLLFQLPPNLRVDVPLLQEFLELLPPDVGAAFEFRHRSWREDAVFEALRARNAAWCVSHTGDESAEIVATADWGYLRLRRDEYSADELRDWAERIRSQEWREAYVFFKHEEAGGGPRMAASFLEICTA